jgi:nitrogen fixation-related uncharacterized protein
MMCDDNGERYLYWMIGVAIATVFLAVLVAMVLA